MMVTSEPKQNMQMLKLTNLLLMLSGFGRKLVKTWRPTILSKIHVALYKGLQGRLAANLAATAKKTGANPFLLQMS